MNNTTLKELPLPIEELETRPVLKQLATAHRYLAELKGLSVNIPNQNILINTLGLQEAKDSSAIENIITTHDEVYKAELFSNLANPSSKEVQNYTQALTIGYHFVKENQLLTCGHILAIQEALTKSNAGFRKLPGTVIKNFSTNTVVYEPPQDHETIVHLMRNLEHYINDDQASVVDPLVKMAVIHHQFESIHPFYDGNGRTGRIINILYLILTGLLDMPMLYLSQYIIEKKSEYYQLLQTVRETGDWEAWILYMVNGVEVTARQGIITIKKIIALMQKYKRNIRENFNFYSQDLIHSLFSHPYTKIKFIERDLKVSRLTATKYLDQLTRAGYLEKHKIRHTYFYINRPLFDLLTTD